MEIRGNPDDREEGYFTTTTWTNDCPSRNAVSPTSSISSVGSTYEETEDDARQIFRMMEVADRTSVPFATMTNLVDDPFIKNRSCMVEWMMREYLHRNACEIRDTSVRIMDTYLALQHAQAPEKLRDHQSLAFVGAAAMILASKLHQSKYPITASCFAVFNTEELAAFETHFVLTAGKYISPLCTPSSFLPFIIEKCKDMVKTEILENMAVEIIGDFLEDPVSMLFAPSTIAIGAVHVCLSLLHLPCDPLIERLPIFMLKPMNAPFFQPGQGKEQYMDISQCIRSLISKRQLIRRSNSNGSSDGLSQNK